MAKSTKTHWHAYNEIEMNEPKKKNDDDEEEWKECTMHTQAARERCKTQMNRIAYQDTRLQKEKSDNLWNILFAVQIFAFVCEFSCHTACNFFLFNFIIYTYEHVCVEEKKKKDEAKHTCTATIAKKNESSELGPQLILVHETYVEMESHFCDNRCAVLAMCMQWKRKKNQSRFQAVGGGGEKYIKRERAVQRMYDI